jgi:16S rRNA (uracil1498-N3)-methyltransferase
VVPAEAAAHVFVEHLSGDSFASAPVLRLTDEDARHLTRVLRLPPGADVTAGDGRGAWRHCRLRAGGELEPVGDIIEDRPPRPQITVAFALVKGDRPEQVVRRLTEIGVDRIVPFVAQRTVVHWSPSKVPAKLQRLTHIGRSAAMQSRRTFLPAVGMVDPAPEGSPGLPGFARVAALEGAVLADAAGAPPALESPTILVGPEGGWGPDERQATLPRVRLGANVLRTETAAIVAGALLIALRGEIVATAEHFG